MFHEPSIFIATAYRQRSQLREASPSVGRVPPPDPGGAISSVHVPPPEPLPCQMFGGNGLPRGVRGGPFSLLQRWNRPQTPSVPESADQALDMLIRSSKATLKLSGSVTCIHQEPLSREMAAIEASRILEESSYEDLVLQHLGWIADISQVLAAQILISEKRTNLLLQDKVISAIDPKKVEIVQRYLQWLIEDQDSDDSRFHTAYTLLLTKSVLKSYEMECPSENSVAGMLKDETSISNAGRRTISETPVRERFQIFLQSSDLYDAEEVLDMIEQSDLWLEKAILYRKLGQEMLVLQILALKLENCQAAEQYCAEIGRPEAYIQLLEMYLDPKDGRGPMFKAAVHLLHNHGELLDPMQVLERLSSDIPLQLASATILRLLRAWHHHHRQGLIVHSLSHALHVDLSLARLEERSCRVLIDDESVCDSCHACLGTKLFTMYPDDTIVCYKCYHHQGESTSVANRDFKKDRLVKPGWLVTR